MSSPAIATSFHNTTQPPHFSKSKPQELLTHEFINNRLKELQEIIWEKSKQLDQLNKQFTELNEQNKDFNALKNQLYTNQAAIDQTNETLKNKKDELEQALTKQNTDIKNKIQGFQRKMTSYLETFTNKQQIKIEISKEIEKLKNQIEEIRKKSNNQEEDTIDSKDIEKNKNQRNASMQQPTNTTRAAFLHQKSELIREILEFSRNKKSLPFLTKQPNLLKQEQLFKMIQSLSTKINPNKENLYTEIENIENEINKILGIKKNTSIGITKAEIFFGIIYMLCLFIIQHVLAKFLASQFNLESDSVNAYNNYKQTISSIQRTATEDEKKLYDKLGSFITPIGNKLLIDRNIFMRNVNSLLEKEALPKIHELWFFSTDRNNEIHPNLLGKNLLLTGTILLFVAIGLMYNLMINCSRLYEKIFNGDNKTKTQIQTKWGAFKKNFLAHQTISLNSKEISGSSITEKTNQTISGSQEIKNKIQEKINAKTADLHEINSQIKKTEEEIEKYKDLIETQAKKEKDPKITHLITEINTLSSTIESLYNQKTSINFDMLSYYKLDDDLSALNKQIEDIQQKHKNFTLTQPSHFEQLIGTVITEDALGRLLNKHTGLNNKELISRITTGRFTNILNQHISSPSHTASTFNDLPTLEYAILQCYLNATNQKTKSGVNISVDLGFEVGRVTGKSSNIAKSCVAIYAFSTINDKSKIITHMTCA